MKPNHDQLRQLIGLYVLGGLDPGERRAFDDHLRSCPACEAELAELEGLPALLDAIPRDVALELAEDTEADVARNTKRLMSELHVRRRKQRRRVAGLVALVAAASLVVGAVVGPMVTKPQQTVDSYTMTASSGLEVQLDLVYKAWGTELAMDGERLPNSGILSLWITDSTGEAREVASWKATPAGRARLSAATAVDTEEIVRVEIKDADKVPVASVVTRD